MEYTGIIIGIIGGVVGPIVAWILTRRKDDAAIHHQSQDQLWTQWRQAIEDNSKLNADMGRLTQRLNEKDLTIAGKDAQISALLQQVSPLRWAEEQAKERDLEQTRRIAELEGRLSAMEQLMNGVLQQILDQLKAHTTASLPPPPPALPAVNVPVVAPERAQEPPQ